MPAETLTCAFGHTWTRQVARGRKPELCPEHKAAEDKALAEAAAKKRLEAAAPRTRVSDEALDILTGETWLDKEYERKLQYVVDHIDEPDAVGRGLVARQTQPTKPRPTASGSSM